MKYKGTILQFDVNNALVATLTGELKEIVSHVEYADKFYYRFPAFSEIGTKKKIRFTHFGLVCYEESCTKYNPEELIHYRLNHLIEKYYKYRKIISLNDVGFDQFILIYARQLQITDKLKENSSSGFNERLNAFLERHSEFKEVTDLREYKEKKGIYLLVLDEYNACYIGQTKVSFVKRIRQHWSKKDYFGGGIDRFKAMDTTRIYVYPLEDDEEINDAEYNLIPDFPEQYTLNFGNLGGDVEYMKTHFSVDNIEPFFNSEFASLSYYIDIAKDKLGIIEEK